MKRFILGLLLFFFSLSAIALNHDTWKGKLCPSKEKLQTLLNQTVQSLPPAIGVSIAISNPTCGSFNYAIGNANLATQKPLTAETKMPIASNTKPIIVVLMLKLIEAYPKQFPLGLQTKLTDITDFHHQKIFSADGKLYQNNGNIIDLADPDFYRFQAGHAFKCHFNNVYQCPQLDKIDLYHLLMESSGLSDIFLDMDLHHDGMFDITKYVLSKLLSPIPNTGEDTFTDVSLLKQFGLIKKANPDPIIPMQSHNTDAALLAIILERVSGQTLNELLNEKILRPLGIQSGDMYFLTAPSKEEEEVTRRYVYLNHADEIESAIRKHQLDPQISVELARNLKSKHLRIMGRNIFRAPYYKNNLLLYRPMLDVLELHAQGFIGVSGAGGIVAKPKAYIQFYKALASGQILNAKSQAAFNASFIDIPNNEGLKTAMGFGSNIRISLGDQNQPVTFLTHAGLVLGGESQVLYNYETDTTIMIATNFSGYFNGYGKSFPCFFVTPTEYFGFNEISKLIQRYAGLFVT